MEKLSALMDGELDAHQARQELSRLKQDKELLHHWHTFHLIGDALRGERALSQEFNQRVTERLSGEPTVLAPRRSAVKRFTAYALSVAASLAAVALVGWVAFFNNPLTPQPEIAKAPATLTPAAAPSPQLASVPSDGKMNEYLIAHQEFSPSTAIQGLVPYIRSVSSAQPAKGR
ncbi:MAG: sigma-E factor negative regulatory protein [Betaproteobacteria bacterium]|nr:sigma-E factor negative regulatory protein [Betaproteobacteria bacterium]